eukprot:scaffold19004_cov125-Cylindrotheca_fusiformis.AAC.2
MLVLLSEYTLYEFTLDRFRKTGLRTQRLEFSRRKGLNLRVLAKDRTQMQITSYIVGNPTRGKQPS